MSCDTPRLEDSASRWILTELHRPLRVTSTASLPRHHDKCLLTCGVRSVPKEKPHKTLVGALPLAGGRLRRLLERNFPRRENALHHQRPNQKLMGFLPFVVAGLPNPTREVYMNIPMCQQKNPRIARGLSDLNRETTDIFISLVHPNKQDKSLDR